VDLSDRIKLVELVALKHNSCCYCFHSLCYSAAGSIAVTLVIAYSIEVLIERKLVGFAEQTLPVFIVRN